MSRRISWEQTVEDVATELAHFEPLIVLAQFRNLVIRFGHVGALHIETVGNVRRAQLIYAPLARDGVYREPTEDGRVHGKNTLFIAAMIRAIQDRRIANVTSQGCEWLHGAIKTGLLACLRAYDNGYDRAVILSVLNRPAPDRKDDSIDSSAPIIRNIVAKTDGVGKRVLNSVGEALKNGYRNSDRTSTDQHFLASIPIPTGVLHRQPNVGPYERPKWHILRQQFDGVAHIGQSQPGDAKVPDEVSRINYGIAIVAYGQKCVLNREWPNESGLPSHIAARIRDILERPPYVAWAEEPRDYMTLGMSQLPAVNSSEYVRQRSFNSKPICVPTLQLGSFVSVEREVLESVYGIRNLMKAYVQRASEAKDVKPLSIAVFGPPGSGKSFVVKEIAKNLRVGTDGRSAFEAVECNLAQVHTVDDLIDALTHVASLNNEGRFPLVFFDEFDAPFDGESLGWLKFFLSPMQDGNFLGSRQLIALGRAVFVFAGGVYESFSAFDPTTERPHTYGERGLPQELEVRLAEFKVRKGPDFVSRLRGHINVPSINPISDREPKHIIRRALTLRNLLEKYKFCTRIHQKPEIQVGEIDEEIIYALLTIDRYRHGTRSMEAVLQMCTPIQNGIRKASLPSRAQLDMHVNADEFFIRMYRGRARPTLRQPSGGQHSSTMTDDETTKNDGTPSPIPSVPSSLEKASKAEGAPAVEATKSQLQIGNDTPLD